jgi:hypothetical protein
MTEPPTYPRQELLPQEVQPSRSRLPLVLVGTAVVIALVGGLIAWWALRDDGEDHRAAYCHSLRSLMAGEGLDALAEGVDSGPGGDVPQVIRHLVDVAPSSVRGQWDDLVDLVQSIRTDQPDVGQALRALGDLRAIADDAKSGCGITLQIPG